MVRFSEQAAEEWKEAEEEESRSSLQLALLANEFQTASDRKCKRWHLSLVVRWLKELWADKSGNVLWRENHQLWIGWFLGCCLTHFYRCRLRGCCTGLVQESGTKSLSTASKSGLHHKLVPKDPKIRVHLSHDVFISQSPSCLLLFMFGTHATELSPDQIYIHLKGFDLWWAGDSSSVLKSPQRNTGEMREDFRRRMNHGKTQTGAFVCCLSLNVGGSSSGQSN